MGSRKNNFLSCLVIVLFSVAGLGVSAASATDAIESNVASNDSVTLRDALVSGIFSNPEYGVVAADKLATDEGLVQGKALFRPVINLRADTGYEHSDDAATRSGVGSDTENLSRYEASVTLTQLLFDGFESKNEVLKQKSLVNSSAHRVRETVELVGLSIVESYLDVLRQRELLEIARNNVSDHLSIFMLIKDGVKVGRSTLADKEQARSRVASARTTQISTRQALRNAESEYRRNVGVLPEDLSVPTVLSDVLAQDVTAEALQALSHSPTLDVFQSDIEAAHATLQQARAAFSPQVDFQLNARQGNDISGVDGRDTSASALVVMNWNLYSGGANKSRQRESAHLYNRSKQSRERALRAVENDVYQTWASMEAAGERSEQFAQQVASNMKVVGAYKDQFSLGRRTLLDLLDIQNELFSSRSSKVNSEFLRIFAVYRLLVLKGALLSSMGVEYPQEKASTHKSGI